MNGRIYDPTIGRMMSVDPVYQAPTNSQSVNPYSYVMNNPLSLTDPSGYAAGAACNTGQPGSTPSCDPSNIDVSSLKPGQSVTATVTTTTSTTGSHIDSHTTVTGTVTMNKDGSVTVTMQSPNGSQSGNTGTSEPTGNNSGGSAEQGSPAQRPLVSNDGKGNVSLTTEGAVLAVATAKGLPPATDPKESYEVIGAGGDVSKLQTQGCDNQHCDLDGKTLAALVRTPVIVVHDHQNDPAGGLANEGRAWPGPGDQNIVTQGQIVNVFKGNDGGVRAIELRDGKPVVRTLNGGVDKLNNFIQRNWQPFKYPGDSMPESAISTKQQEYDDGPP